MMRSVELPSGEIFTLREFADAIVESILPMRLDAIRGIECIVGIERTYDLMRGATCSLPMEMPIPEAIKVTRPLEHDWGSEQRAFELAGASVTSEEDEVETGRLTLPYAFSALKPQQLVAERAALESLLPKLPLLQYPLSNEMIAAFMTAYDKHENRPDWNPIFLKPFDMERRKHEFGVLVDECLQELLAAAQEGQVVIVDQRKRYVSPSSVGSNFDECFIQRNSALIFLQAIRRKAATTNDRGEVEAIRTKDGRIVWREGKTGRWPEGELRALVEFVDEIDPETGKQKHTLTLAAKLVGLALSTVSDQYHNYKKELQERENQKTDLSWKGQFKNGPELHPEPSVKSRKSPKK